MGSNSSFNLKTKKKVLTKLRKKIDKIKKIKNRLKSIEGNKIYYLAIKKKLKYQQKFEKKSKNAIKKQQKIIKKFLEGHLVLLCIFSHVLGWGRYPKNTANKYDNTTQIRIFEQH